ncbi:MAG: Uncharacterised protein [SAR116 cluster bacterium]|nr:MAG: Uncharacterised protein [SAR116 cluster bacterium]
MLLADRTDKAHALRLRKRQVAHEAEGIRGSRYPKLDGVLDGTIFDVTDYEDEYELVGRIEMTMPLYDGGTARARLRETDWRTRELQSSLDALYRNHARESESLAQRVHQLVREESEALARRDELQARLRAQLTREGQTVSAPLALARLHAEIGAAEVRIAEIASEHELNRARALLVAEQLDKVLGLAITRLKALPNWPCCLPPPARLTVPANAARWILSCPGFVPLPQKRLSKNRKRPHSCGRVRTLSWPGTPCRGAGTPAGNRVCRTCKDSGRGCSGRHRACRDCACRGRVSGPRADQSAGYSRCAAGAGRPHFPVCL